MSSLEINIEVDPTQAVAGAKKATDELAKAEAQGLKVKAAMTALGQSFAKVGEAMRADLSASLSRTAQQFGSLTEAIRREQQVLERIHGPARRYAEDLQTLDSMLARNVISTREYADQVARLNQQIASTPQVDTKVARGADLLGGAGGAGAGGGGGKLSSIAAGVGALNFKQAAQGANQAFELLNQKLQITDSTLGSAIGSAVKFGAAGAQMGGPWGAAIGAVVGVTSDLVGKLFDAEAATRKLREENEREATAYWESVKAAEQKQRVTEALAPALADLARAEQEIAERTATTTQINNAASDQYRKATDAAQAYADQLMRVNGELAIKLRLSAPGSDPLAGGGQTDDQAAAERAARGLRDAQLAAYAAGKSYGATLVELEQAEAKRTDRLKDLEQILGDMNVSHVVGKRALKEYNELVKAQAHEFDKAATAAKHLTDAQKLLLEQRRLNKMGLDFETSSPRASGNEWGGTEDEMYEAMMRQAGYRNVSPMKALEATSTTDLLDKGRESLVKASEAMKKTVEDAQALEEKLGSMDAILRDQLIGSAREFSSTLVDAASGADVSWSGFFESFLVGMQKAIAQALLLKALTGSVTGVAGAGGAYGGLFGMLGIKGGRVGFDAAVPGGPGSFLPGFRTGGDMLVGGSGGPDTKIAAFRVSPGETIHVRTPEQHKAAAQAAGGSGPRVVNITVPGAHDQVTEHNLEDLTIRVIERRAPAIRRAITGR